MAELDAMQAKIKQWREANKEAPRDFDFGMLCTIVDALNDSSAVKVACNPLDEERNWVPDAVCRNVGKVDVDDQGRLVLAVRHDKEELPVEKLALQIRQLKKRRPADQSPVMLKISDTKTVRITDAYSHALVRDSWAGLPFDLVLAYYEND